MSGVWSGWCWKQWCDLVESPMYRSYKARLDGIERRYEQVMRRNGWRHLYGNEGPWYRPR